MATRALAAVRTRTAYRLRRHGCASFFLETDLLLRHVLRTCDGAQPSRAELLALAARGESQLDGAQVARLDELASRRMAGEPLAYVLGSRAFCDDEFVVTRDVLVPRPASETLVQCAVAFLLGLAEPRALAVAELGIGSGCVALSIVRALQRAGRRVHATGVDVSGAALAIARLNAARLGLSEAVTLVEADWCAGLPPRAGGLDCLVANPPYLASWELRAGARLLGHEPRLALDGGEDGLSHYRALSGDARLARALAPHGALLLETGSAQTAAVAALFQQTGRWRVCGPAVRDLDGHPRVVRLAPTRG